MIFILMQVESTQVVNNRLTRIHQVKIMNKGLRAAGECIFTLSESRATSQVHGLCYPAQKTI